MTRSTPRRWFALALCGLLVAFSGCQRTSTSGLTSDPNPISSPDGDGPPSPDLVAIEVDPSSGQIQVGGSLVFRATGVYDDGTQQEISGLVSWHVSDPDVASIQGGLLTGLAAGSTDVFCELFDIESIAVPVVVTPPTLDSLQLISQVSVLEIGQSTQLFVLGTYSDGQVLDLTGSAAWTNGSPGVIEITPGSPATALALAPGSATIGAEVDGVGSNPVNLEVAAEAAELESLTLTGPAELGVGLSGNATVLATYSDGSSGDVTSSVSWTNSDDTVLEVQSGSPATLTALAIGTAEVSADFDGLTSNVLQVEVVAGPDVVILMNAAGPEVEADGETFLADAPFEGTDPGFTGGSIYQNNIPISGTANDALYHGVRWGNVGFQANVPNGQYQVELHFAEIYPGFGPGARVFDVVLEGTAVENDLDVAGVAGFATALVRTHFTTVTDGTLDLAFSGTVNNPILSAVEIRAIDGIPDQEITGLILTPSEAVIFEGGLKAFTALADFNFGPQQNVNESATWTIGDPSVLTTTDTAGLLEALAVGTTPVTVSYEGFSATAQVEVLEAPPVGESLIFVRGNHENLFDVIPRDRYYIENTAHADIMKLEPISPNGTVTNLTNLPTSGGAAAFTPSVTPDGQFILFSMRQAYTEMYEIYRMRTDGTELTQLTFPPSSGQAADKINPVLIGGNRIAYLSNRDFMYDEYGKRNQYNLYTMNLDGSGTERHLDGLSGNFEPDVFADGSVIFTRWDYRPLMNKVTVDNYSLWRMNTDGSDLRPLWGLHYLTPRPGNHGIQDWRRAHELPDGRMVTVGMARTYTQPNYGSGFIAIVDPITTMLDPFTNITPNVPMNSDPSPVGRYLEAVPWGNDQLVVVHSDGPVAYGHGEPNWDLKVMNVDGSGEYTLLEDSYHLAQPRVVAPRPMPPFISSVTDPSNDYAVLSSDNVFIQNYSQEIGALNRPPLDPDDPQLNPVKVRLVEGHILKKTQFYNSSPKDTTFISDVKASLAYSVLGEVPIHSDGSFAAKVPANRPIAIQVLNQDGQAIITMPFWTMAAPGETKRCIGCHDPHDNSVALQPSNEALEVANLPDATQGEIFDYQDDLAPILANRCGSCHSGPNPPSLIDLSGDRTLFRDLGYRSLADQHYGKFGVPSYVPFSYLASKDRGIGGVDSFILGLVAGTSIYGGTSEMNDRIAELAPTHAGLLTDQEQHVLAQWTSMATLFGTPFYRFVPEGETDNHVYPQPDQNLWDNEVAPMLVSRCGTCHNQYPSALPVPGFTVNTSNNARSANVNHVTVTALMNRTGINSNFDHPQWSPILKLGLGNHGHPAIFSSTNDPDYQVLLEWIQSGSLGSN